MTGETENLGAPSHAPDPEPPPNGLTLTCLIFLTVSLFSITRCLPRVLSLSTPSNVSGIASLALPSNYESIHTACPALD